MSLIINFWETNAFSKLVPNTVQKLTGWLSDFDNQADVLVHAMEYAIAGGTQKMNFAYVNGILKKWQTRGFRTLADVLLSEKAQQTTGNKTFSKADIVPDWLEKYLVEQALVDEQAKGIIIPRIHKDKPEIVTDPVILERISKLREDLKAEIN
ncbi:DnaD domain-containing protein [Brochothrix thermosphacta]